MRRATLFWTMLLLAAGTTGCVSEGWSRGWRAMMAEAKEDAKAMSGTGEYLGWSDQSRDVERSLQSQRSR